MTELSDLLLDDTGDFLMAEHEDGEVDLVFWSGAEVVLQSVMTRIRLKLGSVWYNRQAGIDHQFLFFSRDINRFIESLQPIARAVFRRQILETDGVKGFELVSKRGQVVAEDITFKVDTSARTIQPIIPCIVIDCDNTITRGVIPQNLNPVIRSGDQPPTLA